MIKMISKISVMTLIMISCNLFSDEVHIKEGQLAPDFTLLDQNGKPHTLSTYIGKKLLSIFIRKMILLDVLKKHVLFVILMMIL